MTQVRLRTPRPRNGGGTTRTIGQVGSTPTAVQVPLCWKPTRVRRDDDTCGLLKVSKL